jgi:hypothetical protein
LRAYQEDNRRFENGARRRGTRLSLVVLGACLLLLLPVAGFALIRFAELAVAL